MLYPILMIIRQILADFRSSKVMESLLNLKQKTVYNITRHHT